MDLRTWIITDHGAAHDRFRSSVAAHVPATSWTVRAGGDGSSIAWLLHHLTYHQDLAVQTAVRGRPPLHAEWQARLGLDAFPTHDGLGEAEVPELTTALDLDALDAYAGAVHDATVAWLAETDLTVLDQVPAASDRIEQLAEVRADAVGWLHRMWDGKPVAWFVQWEAIGHPVNHLGEMVAIRGRLGLSPF